jgi:hypothetical protein
MRLTPTLLDSGQGRATMAAVAAWPMIDCVLESIDLNLLMGT